ncbi:hypothetical protein ElyMa_000693200 [Elysia marginata]|uniref:Uncharacterized protein n=1 Tax=Elysia marginata TaxID=1093978 RepID=A0AAV4GJ28_9GAST|nr:hypothetical protein ElyMa_000693200 [Elysia marginata]
MVEEEGADPDIRGKTASKNGLATISTRTSIKLLQARDRVTWRSKAKMALNSRDDTRRTKKVRLARRQNHSVFLIDKVNVDNILP